MKLTQARFGHLTSGRLYLAMEGESLQAYVERVRSAYGALRGVRIVKVAEGTALTSRSLDGYDVPPTCQYTCIGASRGVELPHSLDVLVVDRTAIAVDRFYCTKHDGLTIKHALSSLGFILRPTDRPVHYPYRLSLNEFASQIERHYSVTDGKIRASVDALRRAHQSTAALMA